MKKVLLAFTLVFSMATAGFSFSAVKIDRAGKKIAMRMMVNLSSGKKTTLAVVPFNHSDGTYSQLGNFLASDTVSGLRTICPANIKIAERTQINRIMQELELSASGLVSSDSAVKAGNLTGVDALILGEITDLGSYLKVNARLVDVSTSQVTSHATVKIKKSSTVISMMNKKKVINKKKRKNKHERNDNNNNNDDDGSTILVKNYNGFELKLVKIDKRSDCIYFNFLITNKKSNDRRFIYYRSNFKLIDYSGNEYTTTWVQIGDRKSSSRDGDRVGSTVLGNTLYSGIPVKSSVKFFDFPENKKPRLLILTLKGNHRIKISGFPSGS